MVTGCGGGPCNPTGGEHLTPLRLLSDIIGGGVISGILNTDSSQNQTGGHWVTHPTAVIHATCVALRESSGYTEACNPLSGAAGIFQFMPFWVHGDDWRCDPVKAAGHFWVTWKSEGWGPWHGDIEGGPGSDGNLTGAAAFLGVATKAYQDWQGLKSGDEGLPGNPLNVIKDVVGGFAAVANTFKHFFEWIQNPLTWKILGLTIAGGILLLFGLGLLAFDAFKKEAPSIAGTIARGMAE